MAEFKRLSDVEVVAEPSESANVLIEENGVIKKAPKTAVGGTGGGEIVILYDNNTQMATASDNAYNLLLDKMFMNFAGINLQVWKYYPDYNNYQACQVENVTNYGDYIRIIAGGSIFDVNSDNSVGYYASVD